jgi:uncharacterized protein (TIGR03000 family)
MDRAVVRMGVLVVVLAVGVLAGTSSARAGVWYAAGPVATYAWQPVYYQSVAVGPHYGWTVYRPWRPLLYRVFHPFQRLVWTSPICCDTTWTVVDPCCGDVGKVVEKSGTPTKAEPKKAAPAKAAEDRLTPTPGPSTSDAEKTERKLNDSRSPAPAGRSASFAIDVPAKAKVFINGYETRSSGARRTFVSHNLQDGSAYQYAIRVLIPHEGQTSFQGELVQRDGRTWIELTHETTVHGGDKIQLAFSAEGRLNSYLKLASLPVLK